MSGSRDGGATGSVKRRGGCGTDSVSRSGSRRDPRVGVDHAPGCIVAFLQSWRVSECLSSVGFIVNARAEPRRCGDSVGRSRVIELSQCRTIPLPERAQALRHSDSETDPHRDQVNASMRGLTMSSRRATGGERPVEGSPCQLTAGGGRYDADGSARPARHTPGIGIDSDG